MNDPQKMSCAVLGAGGVGLSIAADLARRGHDVLLVMREESLARYDGRIHVSSAQGDQWQVPVAAAARLERAVDAVFVTVKQPQLEAACARLEPALAPGVPVVSLLNGIDHMIPLRERFGAWAVAGSVRVEAHREAPGRVVRSSLFTELELAAGPVPRTVLDRLSAELQDAGIGVRTQTGELAEATVLWRKLALLAPLALATTAARGPLELVRRDAVLHELMLACCAEICAAAGALGVGLDSRRAVRLLTVVPDRTRSSLLNDVAQGLPSEIHALTEPVLRTGRERGTATTATAALLRAALL